MKNLEESHINRISSIFTELSRKSNNLYETNPNNPLNPKFHSTTEALLILFQSSQNMKKTNENQIENLKKENTLQSDTIKEKLSELDKQQKTIESLNKQIQEFKKENNKLSEQKLKINRANDNTYDFNNKDNFFTFYKPPTQLTRLNK